MSAFLVAALVLLSMLVAGLTVPAHLVRRRLDFCAQILDLLATAAHRSLPFGPLLQRAAGEHTGRRRDLLNAIASASQRGATLSTALANHAPGLFAPRIIAAIQVAEGSAQLAALLRSLAHETSKALAARHQVAMTMFYPICLGLFMIGLQTFYLDFAGAVSANASDGAAPGDQGIALTRTATLGVVVMWLLVGMVFLYRLLGWRIGICQRLVDSLAQRVPSLDRLIRLAGGERLLRSTAALVAAGLSLPQALRRSAPATGNDRLARAAISSAGLMEDGATAELAWCRTLLPEFAALRAATATGSTAPELATALGALAAECGHRLAAQIDRVLRWIQPTTIALFGLLLAIQFAGVFQLIHQFHRGGKLW